MNLNKKQFEFTKAVGMLITYAYSLGYTLTLGDARATSGHKKGSFHYKGLAIDLNLFWKGKYLRDTDDHLELGLYWERIGGTWGGRFQNQDGNHYSWGE